MNKYRSDSNKYAREYRRKEYYQTWKKRPEVKAKIKVYLKEYHKKYGKKPEVIERKRDLTLQRVYGITLQQYNAILERQDYRCAICKVPQEELDRSLAVDHNHKTGKVRGLLCGICNRHIVMVLEQHSNLIGLAIGYLKVYGDNICL